MAVGNLIPLRADLMLYVVSFATGFRCISKKLWDWFVSDFQSKTIKPFIDGITVNYNGCF